MQARFTTPFWAHLIITLFFGLLPNITIAFYNDNIQKNNSCIISTAGIAFGNYNPLNLSPNTSTGRIKVVCNKKTKMRITLSQGNSGSYNSRALTSTTSQLNYNLFTNQNHTRVWGDGTQGTRARNINTKKKTLTAYGRIPAGQNTAKVGNYNDVITVVVTY